MGVPLRRPAALQNEHFVPDVLDPAWLDVFRFCTVPDLGACLSVDRCWRSVADSHHVWADAYERTQRADSSSAPAGEGLLRALIERPFGEDAIGWRVAVLIEDGTERRATGHVVAYSAEADAYLVAYDQEEGQAAHMPREAWEQERRKRTAAMRQNPSLAGKSRFSFLAPPASAWPPRGLMGTTSCGAGPSRGPLLRFRSWKQELENNVRNAPSQLACRLEDHTDEVLFVVFSPCGTRLASCSRDLRTVIFRLRPDLVASSSGWGSATASSSSLSQPPNKRGAEQGGGEGPMFFREAVLSHQTAPCRAIWWPSAPYTTLAVSTEDAGWQGASKVEIWEVIPDASNGKASPTSPRPVAEGLPVGLGARCLFQCQNRPFDIYAAFCPWPPPQSPPCGAATAASPQASPPPRGAAGAEAGRQDASRLCFLAGWAVFRENERYVQWLSVWPGPQHPSFRLGSEPPGGGGHGLGGGHVAAAEAGGGPPAPLARLRLEGEMNYLHCLEVGPCPRGRRILAMTGSTPHLCDEIGLIDLSGLRPRVAAAAAVGAGGGGGGIAAPAAAADVAGEGPTPGQEAAIPAFDAPVEVKSMGERVVLSAKWSSKGDLILLNTRPYAHASNPATAQQQQQQQQQQQGAAGRVRSSSSSSAPPGAAGAATAGATFEDLLLRPAPDLSTSMELLLLDAQSLDTIGIFDGHFAFTTKESPFLIFTDEWADSDFLASGGEDHRVYVWHRRHRRLIRRLRGHTEPVNAVSWNGAGLLASASDDHSIIIWSAGGAGHSKGHLGEASCAAGLGSSMVAAAPPADGSLLSAGAETAARCAEVAVAAAATAAAGLDSE